MFYIDAHADINTTDTTGSGTPGVVSVSAQCFSSTVDFSGNLHGMPLSFLLGLGSKLSEFAWLQPRLKSERLVYIGLRDLDVTEKRILQENNIKAFSIHELDRYGIGKVVEMALDHVNPNRDLPIHVSFDIDALDPSVAPSTGFPVRQPNLPPLCTAYSIC